MNALVGLQDALNEGTVAMRRCDGHPDLAVHLDHPLGNPRFTYAAIVRGKVQAIALLTPAEPIDGIPCFQVGYAVVESMRGHGLAKRTASHAIDELRNGLKRNGVNEFYVEAIVAQSNAASIAVARQLLSDDPATGTDEHSDEPIFQYAKLIT
jgi:hypothetical protein